ncbi:MAG: cytochrome c peroxidase [Vicinamibacterales bacterium]
MVVPVDRLLTSRFRAISRHSWSAAKAELGRHLFYDTRLSGNGTQACASCHEQGRVFTDGHGRAVGSTGHVRPRGSMSLVNVAYAGALTWGNPAMKRLEEQALVPMFADQPIERVCSSRVPPRSSGCVVSPAISGCSSRRSSRGPISIRSDT